MAVSYGVRVYTAHEKQHLLVKMLQLNGIPFSLKTRNVHICLNNYGIALR